MTFVIYEGMLLWPVRHMEGSYRYGQGSDFNGKDPGTFDKSREDMNEDGLNLILTVI